MIAEFEKYVGFRILKFFLFNPKTQIHLKGVVRRLKISPSATKFYCDLFSRGGLFNVARSGNLRIFSLNNESVYVKELKKVFALLEFKECGIERMTKKGSLAVYGSYASGEFDEKSDLDILVIGDEKDVDKEFVLKFEKKINKQVQLTVMPYYKWEKMKQQKNQFVSEVISNHILVKGVEL